MARSSGVDAAASSAALPLEPATLDTWRAEGLLAAILPIGRAGQLVVPASRLREAAGRLKTLHDFDMLIDVTCVDYLAYPERQRFPDRFGLVYQLLSTAKMRRLVVRVFVGESSPSVPSLVPIWESANWLEREVWDLFGIRFEGHPDLRRIVLPETFGAHPLRKDYPLQGLGERHRFPELRRGES